MRVAVKPVVTTGVALVGASVIAVSPISPSTPALRVVESDVSLTASVAYVPINMIEQMLSAPANMVAAVDRLATALAISGSWNENQPNNQWGWDEANPAMLMESINALIPFPAFSEPWGRHVNWWVTANLPMHEGCNFDCPDLPGMLGKMFKVPMSEFYSDEGYTFPVVRTPVNGVETPWSQQTVKLDPAEPLRSVWDSWTAEPTGIETTTLWETVTAFANLAAALQITGHMPDWVAVREIERFFKAFLRPPAEEETGDEQEDPAGSGAAAEVVEPELVLVSTATVPAERKLVSLSPVPVSTGTDTEVVTGDESSGTDTEVDTDAAEEDSGTADTDTDAQTPSAESVIDGATSALKRKFALVTERADADADADDEKSTSSTGKHRKPDTAASDTAASETAASDTASSESDSGTADSGDSDSGGGSGADSE